MPVMDLHMALTWEELVVISEIADIALAENRVRERIAEKLDLSDEEIERTQSLVNEILREPERKPDDLDRLEDIGKEEFDEDLV